THRAADLTLGQEGMVSPLQTCNRGLIPADQVGGHPEPIEVDRVQRCVPVGRGQLVVRVPPGTASVRIPTPFEYIPSLHRAPPLQAISECQTSNVQHTRTAYNAGTAPRPSSGVRAGQSHLAPALSRTARRPKQDVRKE